MEGKIGCGARRSTHCRPDERWCALLPLRDAPEGRSIVSGEEAMQLGAVI
jgi:hypothetical protein